MVTDQEMPLWKDYDMMLNLCYVEYIHACRYDNRLQKSTAGGMYLGIYERTEIGSLITDNNMIFLEFGDG